jgi:hypothetical protein
MKTKKIKYCYSSLIAIALVIIFTNQSLAQNELDKTSIWKYKINDGAVISLNNYECDLEIVTTGGNEVKFEMFVYAESSDEEDIKTLEKFLENQKFSATGDRIDLSTQIWKKMNSKSFMNSKRTVVTLLNDEEITLSDLDREARLTIPESVLLKLESKYSDVELDDVHKLELKSYNDKIYGGDIRQPAKIEAKYSKMEFEETKDLTLDLYDCTFEASEAKVTSIKSKYSNIEIVKLSTISIDSYDDKFEFENTGDISMVAKYSDLNLSDCGNMVLEIYDSSFDLESLKNLTIKVSKYSNIEFEQANDIKIHKSYDDQFSANNVNSIEVGESKYSDFEIEILKDRMTIIGYDDNITIGELGNNFTLLDADIKYGKISIADISDDSPIKLDIKSKYGNLNFDKEEFFTQVYINQDDDLEYKGYKVKNTDDTPILKVRGYDLTINLDDY